MATRGVSHLITPPVVRAAYQRAQATAHSSCGRDQDLVAGQHLTSRVQHPVDKKLFQNVSGWEGFLGRRCSVCTPCTRSWRRARRRICPLCEDDAALRVLFLSSFAYMVFTRNVQKTCLVVLLDTSRIIMYPKMYPRCSLEGNGWLVEFARSSRLAYRVNVDK